MNLDSLTPEQLLELKAKLDQIAPSTSGGRTAEFRPRQLTNLTLQPSAIDARPLFVWSAEQPRDYVPKERFYPALIWHQETGEERTIHSPAEREALGPMWQSIPPSKAPVNPMADLQAALDGLTPEERELIIQAQQQDRMAKLQARLASLSEAQLEALLGAEAPRKRGRPRKTA